MNARFLSALALSAAIVGFTPQAAFADQHLPFRGSFAVAFSGTPNATGATYCGGPVGTRVFEVHGTGFTSLGAFSFTLFKTTGAGILHGCLTLTAPDGDLLEATYVGSGLAANSNNFSPSAGTLTFTGGTGRFENATGSATWSAMNDLFYPASSFAGGGPATAPTQGMAFYMIDGKIRRGR
jgi:hypothetical protein